MTLREHIAALPFVDTHSHMAGGDFGSPADDRGGKSLPQILFSDHLRYLLEAQGAATELLGDYRQWRPDDAEAQMRLLLPLLDRVRHLTAYGVVRDGLRELYRFSGEDIDEDNWRPLNEQLLQTYRRHGERAWQREVLRRAGVVLQNQMVEFPYVTDHFDSLPPGELAAQKMFLLPSLILDGFLFSGFAGSAQGRTRAAAALGGMPATHAAYLAFLDKVLDTFASRGGRSAKLMLAYHRPLRFEHVPDMEASRLFARNPERLRGDGLRRLQDNLAWHLLERCARRRLPLIIHTGYSIPTDFADPEHLLPLITSPRLAGLKFDLCHSGWPRHGPALLLARSYPQVFFNLCWTPVLSRSLGTRLLSEAIDMLPADKILLGTDTGTAEACLGAVRLLRAAVADVLEAKVAAGQFPDAAARRLACAVFLDNPLTFYEISKDNALPAATADPLSPCAPADVPLPFLDPEA